VVCEIRSTHQLDLADLSNRMHYPSDLATHVIDTEFFYGPSLLISPVTEADSTSVTFYVPDDIFYDFFTFMRIPNSGINITHTNVKFTDIPIHIKGGSIIPARINSANTTNALRDIDFELLIAPDKDGKASGSLYLDDGVSIEQKETSNIVFHFEGEKLRSEGSFGFKTDLKVKNLLVMGERGAVEYEVELGLDGAWELDLHV
jgi:alpha-glucosidase